MPNVRPPIRHPYPLPPALSVKEKKFVHLHSRNFNVGFDGNSYPALPERKAAQQIWPAFGTRYKNPQKFCMLGGRLQSCITPLWVFLGLSRCGLRSDEHSEPKLRWLTASNSDSTSRFGNCSFRKIARWPKQMFGVAAVTHWRTLARPEIWNFSFGAHVIF